MRQHPMPPLFLPPANDRQRTGRCARCFCRRGEGPAAAFDRYAAASRKISRGLGADAILKSALRSGRGLAGAVAKWTPVIAANKPAIVEELSRLEPGHVGDWEERAAHLEYDAGLPCAWAEPFARLLCSGPPGDFDPVRWQQVTHAALIFRDQWAAKAHALGWKLDDVIGMDPIALPLDTAAKAWRFF
jgi:hypothetical protein